MPLQICLYPSLLPEKPPGTTPTDLLWPLGSVGFSPRGSVAEGREGSGRSGYILPSPHPLRASSDQSRSSARRPCTSGWPPAHDPSVSPDLPFTLSVGPIRVTASLAVGSTYRIISRVPSACQDTDSMAGLQELLAVQHVRTWSLPCL